MPVDRRYRMAAEAEASKFGASVSFKAGRRHVIMTLHLSGHQRKTIMARTANQKTKEQVDWVRQDVRRLVKEIQCATQKPSA